MSTPSLSFDAHGPDPRSRGTAGARRSPSSPAPSPVSGAALASSLAPARFSLAVPQRARHTPMVLAILALHGVVLFGLMNLQRVRETVHESAPIFLDIVAAPKPPSHPVPPPPRPRVSLPKPPQVVSPLVAPTPSPSPSPLLAQAPLAAPPAPPVEVAQTPPTPAAPAPAPVVRNIPASAVQYLVPPAPVYSRTSARLKEFGRAVVRVYIDDSGMPRSVEISTSSGFARLDESAVTAVKNARFKPYTENGAAMAGWAFIPIEFELPK